MIRYTVLCDYMLSMHLDQRPAPIGSIVARGTQSRLGWACFGAALAVHAMLAGLLLQTHPAAEDAIPARPFEVTMDLAPAEPAPSPSPPAPAAAPSPMDLPPPPSAPEPEPAAPEPAAPPAPAPPPLPDPAPPRAVPQLPRPSPMRRAAPAAAKARAVPMPRHEQADPSASGAGALPGLPVPAASPAPTQAASPVPPATAEAVGAWRGALAAWLQEHRTYPDAARRDGIEGRAVVRFTIDAAGLVTGVVLVGSSGSPVLDEATLALLRGAHLPAPPAPGPDHLSITLPVRYSLGH